MALEDRREVKAHAPAEHLRLKRVLPHVAGRAGNGQVRNAMLTSQRKRIEVVNVEVALAGLAAP
jgi:hypothetical protein